MRVWMTLLLLAAFLAGCSSDTTTTPSDVQSEEQTAQAPSDAAAVEGEPTAPAAPAETTVVRMGIQEGAGSNLPPIIAVQEGIFAEHGLEVEFVPLQGSALLSSIVSGSVDFFSQAPQLAATASQQGADLRFFCGNVPSNWTSVMAPVESDLPSTADGASWEEVMQALEGKRVGLAALGATQEFWIRALADEAGADVNTMTLTPIGVGPAAIAALDGGQIDAFLGYPFLEQQLVARGDVEVLFPFAEEGPLAGEMITGWIGAGEWLDANAATATAICDSLGEAMAFFQDEGNRDTVDAVLEQQFGIADAGVREEVLDGGVLDVFDPELHCDRLEQAVSVFSEFGAAAAGSDLSCDTLFWSGAT